MIIVYRSSIIKTKYHKSTICSVIQIACILAVC